MSTNPLLKVVAGVALVLAVIALFVSFASHERVALGSTGQPATVVPNAQWFSGGETVGLTGTFNKNTQFGICNLIGGAAGIAASSTANFDCAVKGIVRGDTIFGDLGANAPTTPGFGFNISKAVASTTAGFITFSITNFSGAATTTLGANLTSGIEYLTYR